MLGFASLGRILFIYLFLVCCRVRARVAKHSLWLDRSGSAARPSFLVCGEGRRVSVHVRRRCAGTCATPLAPSTQPVAGPTGLFPPGEEGRGGERCDSPSAGHRSGVGAARWLFAGRQSARKRGYPRLLRCSRAELLHPDRASEGRCKGVGRF